MEDRPIVRTTAPSPASNVRVLAIAQALSASGMMTMVLLGGILGAELSPVPELATLPLSLMIVGMAGATFPAARIMQRYGRRSAFIGSALIAAAVALVVSWAIVIESYWLLCGASTLLGTNAAFQQQHRFAAAECAPPGQVSQAVSKIMLGLLAAAALGPQLTLLLKNLVPGHVYAGSFLGVAVLCLATAAVLRHYDPPALEVQHARDSGRPIGLIVRDPAYIVAVLAGVVAFVTMSFVMTATPISMHVHDGHSDQATAFVIQSHLLAMYAPSLVSGRVIAAIGTRRAMFAGLALTAACIAVDRAGTSVAHYWTGLVLLGVGWNLLYVAATTKLTTTYAVQERFRAQGVNEFAVFGTQALASLLAGPAIYALGWRSLNLAAAAPIVLLAVLLWRWNDPEIGRQSRNSRA